MQPIPLDRSDLPVRRELGTSRTYRWLLAGAVALCWLVCTIAQLEKYLSVEKAGAVALLGCLGIVTCMAGLWWHYRRGRDVNRWAVVAVFGVLVLSFLVLYPKSQRHAANKGSDREDALRVELVAVSHHEYPYDAKTFLGHRPTPLPGAMLLASPFFLTGHIAFQNLAWAAIFLAMLLSFFERRATGVVFFCVFLLAALENLNDFDVGGDYVTNIMYIAVAIFLFDRAIRRPGSRLLAVASIGLLGIALSSRIVYIVALPPLLGLALQKTTLRRALLFISLAVMVAALVTIPVFLPHPMGRILTQLGQNADKFQNLPRWIPPSSLPVAALALGCVAFFIRMNLARVYLLFGSSSLIMILPPMASVIHAEGGLGRPLPTDLEYLAISAIFLSLWLFWSFERKGIRHIECPENVLPSKSVRLFLVLKARSSQQWSEQSLQDPCVVYPQEIAVI